MEKSSNELGIYYVDDRFDPRRHRNADGDNRSAGSVRAGRWMSEGALLDNSLNFSRQRK